MLEQEIGSRLRYTDLLSRYYEPKNVAKRPKTPKILVSKSLHEGFATHFFVDRLWFKHETKTARGNYADIYILAARVQHRARTSEHGNVGQNAGGAHFEVVAVDFGLHNNLRRAIGKGGGKAAGWEC